MLRPDPQLNHMRVLIMARLFIGTFFLFYAQFVFHVERIVFYGIIAAISLASAFYLLWLVSGIYLRGLALTQIFCDLLLESVIVYYTGGADSVFAPIYVLSILSAGFLLSPRASFYIATAGSVCFVAVVLAVYFHWMFSALPFPDPEFGGRQDSIYLFYASYVRITVFFLVAVLTYFFSRMIQKLEDKMKTQERLVFLGEVVSNIAHEIRNPLASISGSVELLAKQLHSNLSEKQQKLMTAVVDESERIKRIFSGLLDYSRVPALELEPVSVADFLDKIILLIQHQTDFSPRIRVNCRYEGKHFKMKADPEYVKQALMNVMVNGCQAMPEGGELTIDALRIRNEIRISISDTGEGMDRKVLKNLFIPFKTTKNGGTGLGLAQTYRIINQHGGRVTVQSQKGQGTRFDIYLPAA